MRVRSTNCLSRHRERLHRMVQMRLDWRLHGRIDASDVIQEAYLEATRRLPAYSRSRGCRFSYGCDFSSANA